MNKIIFWVLFGVVVVLMIVQMVNVIPLLKKGTSDEEKAKRNPKTLILNSLMMMFGGLTLIFLNETGTMVLGIAFMCIGFLSLLFSVLSIKNRK